MRIISGCRKGRKLLAPDGLGTRPTTDRVKESIFNLIQFYRAEAVLDLFAGSGALGIESLSRGAEKVVFVDENRKAFELINENLKGAQLSDNATVIMTDALSYLGETQQTFDLIFLDPPYNKGLISPILQKLHQNSVLNPDGIIVCETESGGESIPENLYHLRKSVRYGKTQITILQQE